VKIRIPTICPREYQFGVWNAVESGAKNVVISWARRHGKDVTTASILSCKALERVGSYYYLFPTRKWAERALWNNIVTIGKKSGNLLDIIFPPEIVEYKNNTDMKIGLINGSVINFSGTDNLDFVGQGGYGYALSEFSLHKEEVTGFLSPILDEGNAFFIANGTMRGRKNLLYQMYEANKDDPNWFTEWLTPQDTKRYCWVGDEMNLNPELLGKIDPLTGNEYLNIQNRVDSKMISYSLARQEYLNEAVADVANSVYGYEMTKLENKGMITPLIHNKNDVVYTFWDLGVDDPTAIVFGTVDSRTDRVQIIDYYENTGYDIKHYIDVIHQKGYNYGGHYMPHDSKKRANNTGTNIIDFCRTEYGFEVRPIPKTNSVRDDIEIIRRFLPSIWINSKLDKLIECLINYQWNPVTGRVLHNEYSHGADAVRMMGMCIHNRMIDQYLNIDRTNVTPQYLDGGGYLV